MSDAGPGELCSGSQVAIFFLCPHMASRVEEGELGEREGGRGEVSLMSFVIRALISPRRLHPHYLITSPNPHLLIPLHWAIGFNI